MKPIPLGTRFYKNKSLSASVQNLINMHVDILDSDTKSRTVCHAKPGRTLFGAMGSSGNVRGRAEMDGVLYVVSGTSLYSVDSLGVETSLGTIPGTGKVWMAVNLVSQLCVTNGTTTLYVYSVSGGLTSVSLTYAAYTCIHSDGYIIFDQNGQNTWGITSNTDATMIDTTEIGATNSSEDKVVGLAKTSNRVLVMCEKSVEAFYVTASLDFPYLRDRGINPSVGCSSSDSIASIDDNIFWFGSDKNVYQLGGLQLAKITDDNLAYEIENMSTISDVTGFCFRYGSKKFYQLTFPSENKTFVFDMKTRLWAQWGQFSNGSYLEEKTGGYIYAYDKHLMTGLADNNIYEIDDTVFDDNGDTIRWEMTLPPISNGYDRFSIQRMIVSCDAGVGLTTGQGSDPVVFMSHSNDAETLGDHEVFATVGKIGEYQHKALFTRLGSTEDTKYVRLAGSDPVKWSVNGVFIS